VLNTHDCYSRDKSGWVILEPILAIFNAVQTSQFQQYQVKQSLVLLSLLMGMR
jgi:hypothetical protein